MTTRLRVLTPARVAGRVMLAAAKAKVLAALGAVLRTAGDVPTLLMLVAAMAVAPASAATGGDAVAAGDAADVAGASLDRPQIVNGLITWEYPAVGVLLRGADTLSSTLTCSGTLIGCSTFITAAHCVCEPIGADCQPGDAGEPNPADYMVFFQHSGFHAVASIDVHPDFDTPTADVAVIHLASPVTGITPMPINTTVTPPSSSVATIVGFGRTHGRAEDFGLKRNGEVSTVDCGTPELVCWDFENPIGTPGEDSNTCQGDSGGPLFWHDGSEDVLAGITSDGTGVDCLPLDESHDANVFHYRSWITSRSGADLVSWACGPFAPVGSVPTTVATFAGTLSSAVPQSHHFVDVPAGTRALRVTMNGSAAGGADFDLYVRRGAQASSSNFDCKHEGENQFASCEFINPVAGTWWLAVQRYQGAGPFQATATLIRTPTPTPQPTPRPTPPPTPRPTPPPTPRPTATPGQGGGPGALELPQQNATQSGVGIVSGWKCNAGAITVRFDGGPPIRAAYGTTRSDTVGACGDDNNAFVLQWNYALLGVGEHVVRIYADGSEFASATFRVATFGVPFLRGASGAYWLADFPVFGDLVGVAWQQAAQRFVLEEHVPGGALAGTDLLRAPTGTLAGPLGAVAAERPQATLAMLEVPQAGSSMSGIGIVSGWACSAARVEVSFDGGARLQAAYGTTRSDTVASCGDDNNAFVLQWNYALLGTGNHTVTVFADGQQIASASFWVQTLGVPFLRGAVGLYELPDFPSAGHDVMIEWQQAAQGFGVVATR